MTMTMIVRAMREVAGLFVDDGWLALAVIAVVALAAGISRVPGGSLTAGVVLLLGCLVALVASAVWTAQRR
jgi:4-amino-4-deoxy-L-arabinose transferase-like glycosyltransferase